MAYCLRCGVELGDGEEICPLCHTPVCHPEFRPDPAMKPYPPLPPRREEPVSRSGVLFLLTGLFVLPLAICFLCDFLLHGRLTWFYYVCGGLLLAYVVLVLPLWFARPNPVIFVPADFAAAALFLLLVNLRTGGGWFLPFALPATAGMMVLVTAVVALVRYVRRGLLYIFGGAVIAAGGYTMLLELLIHTAFGVGGGLQWSWFPMAACFLVGLALIIIAISPGLRESLHKKFFL